MDFDDTPEETAFRVEARNWLESQAGPRTGDLHRKVMSGDESYVGPSRAWQRTLYDAGWAGIMWPTVFGGRGGTAVQDAIFAQEQQRFEVSAGLFMVAITMVGPTIIAHGTDEQKQRFLDPILRGDTVWCQLFSEPGAGSDLANLGTRAERDGDEWVVNGQKVWTSHAHLADWGILLTRSDQDAPKHRGITFFLVDMRTPGIEVRPLRQMTGAAHFNEVFFTDVRIPAANVLGPVNGGWRVTMTTLTSERGAIGGGEGVTGWDEIRRLFLASHRVDDPVARDAVIDAYIRSELLRFFGYRMLTAQSKGVAPGPESSVIKLLMSAHAAKVGDLVKAIQGASGMLADEWSNQFLNQWNVRLGGGTDQVQRNVIGERVLGLPGEPRVDKDVPYRELARPAASANPRSESVVASPVPANGPTVGPH